jgi:hypothetical protein
MYIPELSANLLSVSAITENGGEVIFERQGFGEEERCKYLDR